MTDAPVTVAALLAEAGRRLGEAGLPEPAREALRLWSGLYRESPGAAFLGGQRAAGRAEADAFRTAVARRARGEPLAYVTGCAGFRTLVLRSDRRALIPRPETEGLVELVLRHAPTGTVADVGTGTGCIALSLRAEGAYDTVVATDCSADALALAFENARDCRLEVTLARADLTEPLASGSLDALVSNPPYLTEQEHAELGAPVRDWEPALALPSGRDGLAATRRLLRDGLRALRPAGLLALEVDSRRARTVAAQAGDMGWTDIAVARDLFGRERYLLARRRAET